MVKATTIEILTNFKAVMEELQIAFEAIKNKWYSGKINGKRFPFFCGEQEVHIGRSFTNKIYMIGKYYSDAPHIFKEGYRHKVQEIYQTHFNKDNKNFFRRKKDTETSEQYRDCYIKMVVNLIQENDPETIEYYTAYLKKHYDPKNYNANGIKYEENGGFETYFKDNLYSPSEYGRGFIQYITTTFNRDRLTINEVPPYYSKYKVSRKETKVCDPKFYTHLFTGEHNFSLMKIKHAKGGKITNAGLKATAYYYYNGEKANWEFNSHSKKDELENMCDINNIKYPRHSKYEDLAKLLKEKLP